MRSRTPDVPDEPEPTAPWTRQDTLDEARATYEGMPERDVDIPPPSHPC